MGRATVVADAIAPPTPVAGQDPQSPKPERQQAVRLAVVLGALGVVFGDIGTSPLYALHTVFTIDDGLVRPTPADVLGVVSMMFWSVTLIVSVKYVSVVMRADNEGEGGVMALVALVGDAMKGRTGRFATAVVALGVLGASLFYGDSLITPAISMLGAVEGLKVVTPSLGHLVLPISAAILAVLFAVQRYGTGRVGAAFGPVMVVWFTVLAVAGLRYVIRYPEIVRGLSPTYGAAFTLRHPYLAFVAVGAVVLVITGAEALYADMGHFGRKAIARAWFFIVLPALTMTYLGQAALILHHPQTVTNPFYLLLPEWARLPMIFVATAATIIASQAVISGAFSMTRQAMQLGYFPPLRVEQTSEHEGGQIYLPAVNAALFVGVLTLMLTFESSDRLANAYGVAVTGALLADTTLFLTFARAKWQWQTWKLSLAAFAFGGAELVYFSGNLTKVVLGGWLPLLIATAMFTLMTTWQRGRAAIGVRRGDLEGPLQEFVAELHERGLARVPGTAVYPHPTKETTPLALRATAKHHGVLHENVVVVSARAANVPRVHGRERFSVDDLGYADDGIYHLTIRYGFAERPDLPRALREARRRKRLPVDFDPDSTSYFVSRGNIRKADRPTLARWRRALFIVLAQNAANPADYFSLPIERTVVMGTHVDI